MFAATLRIIVTIVIIHTVIIEDVENCIVLHFSSSPAFPPSPVAATFACCRRVCRQRAPRRVETWPRSHGPQVHMRSCALISNLSESLVCPLILCFLMSGTDDAANATNFDFAEVWVRPTEHRTSKQAPGGRVRVSKTSKTSDNQTKLSDQYYPPILLVDQHRQKQLWTKAALVIA